MATTTLPRATMKGGSFLIESCRPEEIFTPADLSDDQKLVGRTAEEFVTKEILPLAHELEQHKEGAMATLLREAGELGLLGGGVPEAYGGSGPGKISGTLLAGEHSGYALVGVSYGG